MARRCSFGLLVSLAAGLFFALVPALQTPATTARRRNSTTPAEPHRAATARCAQRWWRGSSPWRWRCSSCAGLLTKSFVRLVQVDTGFDYARALVAETELPETHVRLGRAAERVLAQRHRSPVDDAGRRSGWSRGIRRPSRARIRTARSNFSTSRGRRGVRVVRHRHGRASSRRSKSRCSQGRLFDDRDVAEAPHVGGDQPTGGRTALAWAESHRPPRALARQRMDGYAGEPLTVIGIVGNVRHQLADGRTGPEIYAHVFQRPARARDADLVIRSANPAALTAAVRGEFEALDSALPVRAHTLDSSYQQSLAQPRFQTLLIGFFAVCALLLSAAGLYSSMAYAVSRQTREIGIRLALGGAPGAVRREVLRTAMRIAALGAILAGCSACWAVV